MYKISVPVMNENLQRNGKEATLSQLKRLGASRVFLALGRYETDASAKKEALHTLAENCRYFKSYGFEVGAWIWTFAVKGAHSFRKMRTLLGTDLDNNMCPTDEHFLTFATEYIADVARCGVDMIMFDDDFRYGFIGDAPACLCEGHLAHIGEIVGERVSREELAEHITSGKKNKYRDAYLKANGDVFRRFAKASRAAVDKVNPAIRMGACACLTSWELDGVMPEELACLLAGGTKPFFRTIGAPYWTPRFLWGNTLADVIELTRMECAWSRTDDIEIFAEGDVNPRPRLKCPASYLEGFDTALRAAGCTDGILKYGIDYVSSAVYEDGYVRAAERNCDAYAALDAFFADKHPVGVRVWESKCKTADMVMPTKVNDSANIEHFFFSKASRTLAFSAIPTVYEGEGVCGIVFDENARSLPLSALKGGLILDIAAAEILTERGIDTGLACIGGAQIGKTERFLASGNHILANEMQVYDITLKEGAIVQSDMQTPIGTLPISYLYENKDGCRFLVLNYNTRKWKDDTQHLGNPLKHYARARQCADAVKWLSGNSLPAYVYGHPGLYLLCKEGDNGSLAVGLWNFFADVAEAPVVLLADTYKSIRTFGCCGTLSRDTVTLSDISPFAFALFELQK